MTYTKGPWLARGREIGILTTHGDFAVIAEATAVGSHPGANARLIKESPALLAALKNIITILDRRVLINTERAVLDHAKAVVEAAEVRNA